jgi:hypothetical protein
MSQRFATIHIAKSLKKADSQTKTCQRVWLYNHTADRNDNLNCKEKMKKNKHTSH